MPIAASTKAGHLIPIGVEVIRAERSHFRSVHLTLPDGTSAETAAALSGLLDAPEFSTAVTGYAVHGERAQPARPLRDGDRVELLSGLTADPKQARRKRAAGAAAENRR